jgi:hypothetical protein
VKSIKTAPVNRFWRNEEIFGYLSVACSHILTYCFFSWHGIKEKMEIKQKFAKKGPERPGEFFIRS